MSDKEYEVEKILKKEIRDGTPFYLLKWKNYNSRYNTWEPEEYLSCNELIAEFEENRVSLVLGAARRNGQLFYVVKYRDTVEPDCIDNQQARIHLSKNIFDFLLEKIEYVGVDDAVDPAIQFVANQNLIGVPKISYVTDTMGAVHFGLEFPNGFTFVTATEVKEKWIGLALDFLENHLQIC